MTLPIMSTPEALCWSKGLDYSTYVEYCEECGVSYVFEFVYATLCVAFSDQLRGVLDLRITSEAGFA